MKSKGKYSNIYAIISQINDSGCAITKEELVSNFTNRRTTHLSDLTYTELHDFEISLSRLSPRTNQYANPELDNCRKAIIAQFKSIGRTTEAAIAWAEKYGVNGIKRRFNDYTGQELYILIKNAEKVKMDFIKSANKKL